VIYIRGPLHFPLSTEIDGKTLLSKGKPIYEMLSNTLQVQRMHNGGVSPVADGGFTAKLDSVMAVAMEYGREFAPTTKKNKKDKAW
jgi:hypothetical protein